MATFVIVAVFVGYHASQEPRDVAEGHSEIIPSNGIINQVMHKTQQQFIKTELKI